MKYKGIDINKDVVSNYNDEQLAEFAASNGIEDVAELRKKLGPFDEATVTGIIEAEEEVVSKKTGRKN